MMDDRPTRWFHLTPDRLVIGLLVVECLLWLSERYRWFGFNEKKGWTVLIAVAAVGVTMLVMLTWFAVSLVFRWRFQFSIRSLLVLTVAVAVPCSWMAVEMRAATRQKEAVDGVQKCQGNLAYDWELELKDGTGSPGEQPQPRGSAWLRSLLGNDFFDNVVRFDYYSPDSSEVTEEAEAPLLDYLSRFTALRTLDLSNNSVTDADLAKFKRLTRLQSLTLNVCQISAAGLKYLEGMQRLEYLALVCGMPNRVTDTGLEYLRGLTRLTHLTIVGVRATDAGLKSIEGLAQLQELDLSGSEITNAGLDHLTRLSQPRILRFWSTRVTEDGAKKLHQALPTCQIYH